MFNIERMKLLIVGYGQMGRHVENVALERGHSIVTRIDPVGGDQAEITTDVADKADCAVEFSIPDAAVPNARRYAEMGLNAVVGTTGWYDKRKEVAGYVNKAGIGYLYGPNFSLGAHLFFRLVGEAAAAINPFEEYDISGYEIHHKRKKDSPSGTALKIAGIILERSNRKTELMVEKLDRRVKETQLHFASIRGGENPGVHSVLLDCEADTIELVHRVRNRKGFALGAVMAAEWLLGNRGFFTVEHFIADILKK
jgi:4-hydroxy-tetrahydrodipicolinate reductase